MKKLNKYLKKRKAAIDFLLRKPSEKYTPTTFHKLRVEIKKLNSLFDLIHFCSTNFKRKATYKPFKSLFQQAGKARELQIEEAMLKKYLINNEIKDYRKSLKRLRLKAEEDFFVLVNKKLRKLLRKKFQAIIPDLYEIDKKKIKRYLEKKKKKIQELLIHDSIQTEQIHKLRRQLKIYDYNKAIVDKEKAEEKLSKQDSLPDLLGKWHDCQVTIEHLKKTLTNGHLCPTELEELKNITSKIVYECNILFDEIKNALAESGFFGGHNQEK